MVAGAAGIIGLHLTLARLERGYLMVGIDNLNDYHDPLLRHQRLDTVNAYAKAGVSTFLREDIANKISSKILDLGYSTIFVKNLE